MGSRREAGISSGCILVAGMVLLVAMGGVGFALRSSGGTGSDDPSASGDARSDPAPFRALRETRNGPPQTLPPGPDYELVTMTVDRAGTLYFVESYNAHRILAAPRSGRVRVLADLTEHEVYHRSNAGVPGWSEHAVSLVATASGTLYFACATEHRVLEITPRGKVRTVAGRSRTPGNVDGAGADARFDGIHDMTIGMDGVLYVSDGKNRTIRAVRPDDPRSTVSTHTGGPPAPGERRPDKPVDGSRQGARLIGPVNLTALPDGTLLVRNYRDDRRRVSANGEVTTLTPPLMTDRRGQEYSQHRIGPERHEFAMVADSAGNVYAIGGKIQRESPDGTLTTLDPALHVVNHAVPRCVPRAGAVDAADRLYVMNASGSRRRCDYLWKRTPRGEVELLDFVRDGSSHWKLESIERMTARDPIFNDYPDNVQHIAVTPDGGVFLTGDSVVLGLGPDGRWQLVAGLPGAPGYRDGVREHARFRSPAGIAVDRAGRLLVWDSGNRAVRAIASDGAVTTAYEMQRSYSNRGSGTTRSSGLGDLAIAPDGSVYAGRHLRLFTDTDGGAQGLGTAESLAIAMDGTIYRWGESTYQIRSRWATGGGAEIPEPPRTGRMPNRLLALDVAPDGTLYVFDRREGAIWQWNGEDYTLLTDAVLGPDPSCGPSRRTGLGRDLAVDGHGRVWVATEHCLRRATPDGTVTTVGVDS